MSSDEEILGGELKVVYDFVTRAKFRKAFQALQKILQEQQKGGSQEQEEDGAGAGAVGGVKSEDKESLEELFLFVVSKYADQLELEDKFQQVFEVIEQGLELFPEHPELLNETGVRLQRSLTSPSPIEQSSPEGHILQNLLSTLSAQLKPQNQILTLDLDPNSVCFPTVFGILIGYPVVYWYDVQTQDNCLDGVPLEVFQVMVESHPPIVSFSIPVCVMSSDVVVQQLDRWKTLVTDRGFKFTHFVKSLDRVVL